MSNHTVTPQGLVRRFLKAQEGAAALEFSLIAAPFFMLLFGIIEVAMIIFASLILENGVVEATRTLRTGEFQETGGGADEFKGVVCDSMVAMIKCDEDFYMDVKVLSDFGSTDFSDPEATDTFGEGFGFDNPDAGDIVLVRVYYMKKIYTPMLGRFFANAEDNKRVVAWSAAFEIEPF